MTYIDKVNEKLIELKLPSEIQKVPFVGKSLRRNYHVIETFQVNSHKCYVLQHLSAHMLVLELPRLFSMYTIIGIENCERCERLAAYLPMMDHITLHGAGSPLERLIKSQINILSSGLVEYPLLLHKKGNIITPPVLFEEVM